MSANSQPFYAWLQQHHDADTRYGDLARDVRADSGWPRADDYGKLRNHMECMGAIPNALETLRLAYAEWAGVDPQSLLEEDDEDDER